MSAQVDIGQMSCKVIEKNLDFYSSNSIFCSPQDNLEEIIEDRKLAQKVMFQKTSGKIVKRSYCIGKLKCSANDRFEGRSFKKAGVDQLLEEELHVGNLTLLCGCD